MKKLLIGVLVLTLLLTGLGLAAQRAVFIQNQLYNGPVQVVNQILYIPLTDYLNALGLDLAMENGVWKLFPQTQPVTQTAVTQNPCNFSYKDKNFGVFLHFKDNQAYVPLKSMATQMGALFTDNPDTKIIDVSFIQVYTPSPTAVSSASSVSGSVKQTPGSASASSPSPSATPGAEEKPKLVPGLVPVGVATSPYTNTRSKQDLVRVADFDYYQNDSPINTAEPYTIAQASQLRGVLKIKNCSDKPIQNIQTTIHFMDMYGSSDKPIDDMSMSSVTLASGETKEFDVYWNNNSVVRPNPDVEIVIPDKYLEKNPKP